MDNLVSISTKGPTTLQSSWQNTEHFPDSVASGALSKQAQVQTSQVGECSGCVGVCVCVCVCVGLYVHVPTYVGR